MAIRRSIFDAIGGFRDGFGNDGSRWAPEDTDLCIRASSARIEGAWMYEPKAVAGHKVPAEREKQRFFRNAVSSRAEVRRPWPLLTVWSRVR